jgi:hypothetical protein
MQAGQFFCGHDARRGTSTGRPPSGRSIAAVIRRTLGRDAETICQQVQLLARTGDPQAVCAAASLLAAVAQPSAAAQTAPTAAGEP